MRILRFLNVLVLLALLMMSSHSLSAVSAKSMAKNNINSVMAWNAIAQRAIVQVARQSPSHAVISMAYVQAAVYDAVVAIKGRYQPYAIRLDRRPNASVNAAVAAAAYTVLVHYFPAQKTDLDADYNAALAVEPFGPPKAIGIMLGQAAATGIINLRKGDGYQADIGFVMPPPGPGVWQLLPGQTPLIPWLSQLKPFLIERPDQFRPDGPPAFTSDQWVEDYNEVKEIGRSNSQTRTADQTDAARFFTAHPVTQYTTVYNSIIIDQKFSALEAVRLYAMGYLIAADANIACYDAKYEFLFWRPISAIQQGDSDGNADTIGDPSWTPLLPTPPHPEYTSGHGCFTASTAEVLAAVLGTRNINIDLTSDAPNVVKTVRHYNTVDELDTEIVNVRIWSGIHFRNSDVQGVEIGREVARWSLIVSSYQQIKTSISAWF